MTALRTKYAALLLSILLIGAMLCIAGSGSTAAAQLSMRVQLCLETLIPSLFGCTLLADLLWRTGCGQWLGAHLRLIARLLHIPPAAMGIFAVSQLAGYPVGVVLLRRAAETGEITAQEAARLRTVCFGGGPAFLVGLAGAQLFGAAAAGWVMLGACILSNLLLSRLLNIGGGAQSPEPEQCRISAEMLTDSAAAAMGTMAKICGTVLLFGVITVLARQLGITGALVRLLGCMGIAPQTASALLAVLTDVSLLPALFRCGLPFHILLPLTAGLLSFGGICVHVQCLAAGGKGAHFGNLLLMRLCAACITAAVTAAALPLVPLPESVGVFLTQTALSESRSPLPAILIFLTGFPFLLKKD